MSPSSRRTVAPGAVNRVATMSSRLIAATALSNNGPISSAFHTPIAITASAVGGVPSAAVRSQMYAANQSSRPSST